MIGLLIFFAPNYPGEHFLTHNISTPSSARNFMTINFIAIKLQTNIRLIVYYSDIYIDFWKADVCKNYHSIVVSLLAGSDTSCNFPFGRVTFSFCFWQLTTAIFPCAPSHSSLWMWMPPRASMPEISPLSQESGLAGKILNLPGSE